MGPMTDRCGLCWELTPRVVACGGNDCEARVGGCCLSRDGLCVECAAEAANKEETMTLLDAIRELSELFPGRYVNIAVSVGIHKHSGNLPTLGVTCYVDGFGNVAYHAPTIEVAMELSRAKARSTAPLDAAELAISDASLPVEVGHVA